jgi:hypothetical protein
MIVNTNIKERIKTAGLLLLQSYKVIMGTMISVFVPQKCIMGEEETICTLYDNISNDDYTHRCTLVFNCFTTLSFLLLYCVEMNRETWLIKNLDIDHNKADNNLENIIYKKTELKQLINSNTNNDNPNHLEILNISSKLIKYNKYYYYCSLYTFGVFIINNLASINIIKDNNHGSTTLNAYISFLMLILVKLYNAISVSYRCKRDTKALSAYMIEFSSFNTLDSKYNGNINLEIKELENGRELDTNLKDNKEFNNDFKNKDENIILSILNN